MTQPLYKGSPAPVLNDAIGGLKQGQVCVVLSKPGVGKSALMVHVALDFLLRGEAVLHVGIRDTVDHVRAHYDQIYKAASKRSHIEDFNTAMVQAERSRMIHSYLDRDFEVASLQANLTMLKDVASFNPKLVVVDGLSEADAIRCMPDLAKLARSLDVPIWVSVTLGDQIHPDIRANGTVGLRIQPKDRMLQLSVLKDGKESAPLDALLDPALMLVVERIDDTKTVTVRPDECTLYSGGATGAEAAFGEACERWGVHEVNFTFEGHNQARARGRYELSPRELAAGDVSLVYVSRRLSRTYSTEGSLIRKVLQTIWHMVSRSRKVLVIGVIQQDGTVVGGTGWSVELARMWNKDLWVYDQERKDWFCWDGAGWVPGTPVIDTLHFTGTGTRYLTDDGKTAIAELFERSFGAPE